MPFRHGPRCRNLALLSVLGKTRLRAACRPAKLRRCKGCERGPRRTSRSAAEHWSSQRQTVPSYDGHMHGARPCVNLASLCASSISRIPPTSRADIRRPADVVRHARSRSCQLSSDVLELFNRAAHVSSCQRGRRVRRSQKKRKKKSTLPFSWQGEGRRADPPVSRKMRRNVAA